jgi:anti-sigma B factor antagonist
MNFKASIDEHADAYSVVAVRGEVDLHTAPKVQYAIERGSEGVTAVVVDMSGIAFMDSTALSTLGGEGDLPQAHHSLRSR